MPYRHAYARIALGCDAGDPLRAPRVVGFLEVLQNPLRLPTHHHPFRSYCVEVTDCPNLGLTQGKEI
jgi:antitoxin PrlF